MISNPNQEGEAFSGNYSNNPASIFIRVARKDKQGYITRTGLVIILPASIYSQAYIFLCALVGGVLIAFVYDTFRIKRKIISTGTIALYIEDILFWIMVAVIMFMVIYLYNDGEFRGYIIFGSALGAFLYIVLFSRVIVTSLVCVINFAAGVAKMIILVATYPVRLICRILAVPLNLLQKIFKKVFRKIRTVHRINMSRMRVWARIIKNFRKKV